MIRSNSLAKRRRTTNIERENVGLVTPFPSSMMGGGQENDKNKVTATQTYEEKKRPDKIRQGETRQNKTRQDRITKTKTKTTRRDMT